MLKVKYYTRSEGTLESDVRRIVDGIVALWDEIDDFDRIFQTKLKEITQRNHISPIFAFRVKQPDLLERELWHFDTNGVPDRRIATIKELHNQ